MDDLEETAEMGWRTTHLHQPAKLSVDSSPQSDSTQTSSTRSRSKTRPPVKPQILKAGRMPPLPSKEIKIIIRPKGALNVAKISSPTVTTAVFQVAQFSPADMQQDTVCPNTQQNIVVVSTPSRYVFIKLIQVNGVTHDVNAYEMATEDTTKGVIRGIPLSGMSALFPITRSAEVAESETHLPTTRVTPNARYKSRTARYKTPYVIRKRIGERRAATLQESDFPPMNYKHRNIVPGPLDVRDSAVPDPDLLPRRPPSLTNKVRDLKQSRTPPPTPPAEASPCSSHDAPLTPAPK
ncbi:hypothetical protein HPB49_006963 [Dermacentor silvarum]|uniref:Uncharacterized protein n=1 Tax=Dermacentor silvarum TaxID=543639 RepID=A0ACB8DWV8_DERSI|nr:hypothetical protein HPB49_006963 [Dermacentor silvarum]